MAYLAGPLEDRYDVLRERDTGLARQRLPASHNWVGDNDNHTHNTDDETGPDSHTDFSPCTHTRTLSEFCRLVN